MPTFHLMGKRGPKSVGELIEADTELEAVTEAQQEGITVESVRIPDAPPALKVLRDPLPPGEHTRRGHLAALAKFHMGEPIPPGFGEVIDTRTPMQKNPTWVIAKAIIIAFSIMSLISGCLYGLANSG